jgi:hypothetical protein
VERTFSNRLVDPILARCAYTGASRDGSWRVGRWITRMRVAPVLTGVLLSDVFFSLHGAASGWPLVFIGIVQVLKLLPRKRGCCPRDCVGLLWLQSIVEGILITSLPANCPHQRRALLRNVRCRIQHTSVADERDFAKGGNLQDIFLLIGLGSLSGDLICTLDVACSSLRIFRSRVAPQTMTSA